ncbi:hypothetical protein B0H12DRAFT_701330 [Mycena haematopus]|nr:hypothetical protein B0H12DRAFT_701330 [Mycena haematopus]
MIHPALTYWNRIYWWLWRLDIAGNAAGFFRVLMRNLGTLKTRFLQDTECESPDLLKWQSP